MFKLEIETTNAAFDPYPEHELAEILRNTIEVLMMGAERGSLFDTNGNKVGRFGFTPEDY